MANKKKVNVFDELIQSVNEYKNIFYNPTAIDSARAGLTTGGELEKQKELIEAESQAKQEEYKTEYPYKIELANIQKKIAEIYASKKNKSGSGKKETNLDKLMKFIDAHKKISEEIDKTGVSINIIKNTIKDKEKKEKLMQTKQQYLSKLIEIQQALGDSIATYSGANKGANKLNQLLKELK